MSDRVAVMHVGRIEQVAPPTEIYQRPRTAFVAEFVGLTNRLPGVARAGMVDVLDSQVPLLDGLLVRRRDGAGATRVDTGHAVL